MKKIYIVSVFIISTFTSSAQTWSAINTGTDDYVYSLAVYNNELYVGGQFNNAGGAPAKMVAKWNGVGWSDAGAGLGGLYVLGMTTYNGNLYATGDCYAAGSGRNIIKRNGTSWSNVGSFGPGPGVALGVYNGELYLGGAFTSGANHIAKWNDTIWTSASLGGTSSDVVAFCVYNGELYVGGGFTVVGGTTSALRIAKWNGTSWSAVGTGMNGMVQSLVVYNNELYAGGKFTTAGGVSANHIAKWNGISWSAVGTGMNNNVKALAVYDSALYAGGDFNLADGMPADHIAKWNGSAWSPLGTGVDTTVNALCVYNGELYAAGVFINADGITANHIAKWDSGVGINERFINNELNIYPNPASNQIIIEFDLTENKNTSIEIKNILGQTLRKIDNGFSNGKNKIEIDVSEFAPGLYFVSLQNGDQMVSKKIIKHE